MKRTLIYFLFFGAFLGCSDSEESLPKTPDPIIINGIIQGHNPVGLGQKVTLEADLSENLSGAQFKWSGTFNGSQLDNLTTGNERIYLFTNKGIGDYDISLEVISEDRVGNFTKKIRVIESDFEFGMWSNSKEIITDSEELHGNTPFESLIGMPEPYEGAINDRVVYQRSSTWFVAYYFDQEKLKGGSTFKRGPSQNSNGDFIWYQAYYKQDQNKLNDKFKVDGVEKINWNVSDERRDQYLNQSNGQGVSLAVENGHATVSTTWEVNGQIAELRLYRVNDSSSAISYTIFKM